MPRLKTTALLFVALLALVLAGCGGGGGDTESTAATTTEEAAALSKADLISQGDAICAEVNAAVGALGGGESETEAVVGEESEKIANLYTGMVQSLMNLGAPAGDEAGYAGFSEAAEELAKVEGEVKLAAEREDVAALEEAEAKVEPALADFQSEATAYGFEDCGEEPKAPTVTPGTGGAGSEGGEEFEGVPEEGGVEVEPEYEEPEYEEPEYVEPEEAPETGGAGGGEVAPEGGGGETGGSESGGVGPG